MDNIYIEYIFKVEPIEPGIEILIAELGFAGFESFVENDNGVTAYVQKEDWHQEILNNIAVLNSDEFTITYVEKEIEQTNWNSEWEKNFEAIQVNDLVSIRAPFHEDKKLKYDIVIEPKMSFGTGHHETTHMMIQHLLDLDLKDLSTLDMGCGTGILAIFAEMKGANPIDGIDIDNWCYLNSIENADRNDCKAITFYEGTADLLTTQRYDLIIANINRNILLSDMVTYTKCLDNKGTLLLSGFYKEDIPVIDAEVTKYGLSLEKTLERNNWVSLKYVKA